MFASTLRFYRILYVCTHCQAQQGRSSRCEQCLSLDLVPLDDGIVSYTSTRSRKKRGKNLSERQAGEGVLA
jgi:hypothetical protein